MNALLEVKGVTQRFGGITALQQLDFSLGQGEIVGVIGPNGAGKTTLVNAVTGVTRMSAGEVWFEGRSITGLRPDQIARLGIARTFQIVQPFPRMSVLDNVAAAALFAGGSRTPDAARAQAREYLRFCGLDAQADKPAAALTLAGRKRLELAKSLALKPRLLFLDEVNAGLNPAEVEHALSLIQQIAASGVTIVLIEHLMKVVVNSCTRVMVLHQGQLIANGTPQEVVANEKVIEAYLGQRYARRAQEATT